MHLSFSIRVLLVLVAMLASINVGLLAGILTRAEGARMPSCIVRGGAACGVSLTLFILILGSLGALK
ncbi:hypothetical protein ACFO3J_22315 [Streptomyces polygonati]|uniref:Uncharacterized protein n=1 Tax=Streptomyces polygonati TaxID=1617087 RepID=A0ABV8HQ97_9ACTN